MEITSYLSFRTEPLPAPMGRQKPTRGWLYLGSSGPVVRKGETVKVEGREWEVVHVELILRDCVEVQLFAEGESES